MPAFSSRRLFALPIVAAVGFTLAIAAAFSNSASAGPPTVVALYQSQGCSSCPPANENILTLTDRPELLVLSFGVIYWDRLGWKDTFASRENTQLQYDYTNGGLKRHFVATPQVVINGQIDILGNKRAELMRAVDGAKLSANAPAVTLSGARLTVAAAASAPAGGADIWLVRYDPRTVQVPIQAGENGGLTPPQCRPRTGPHRWMERQGCNLRPSGGDRPRLPHRHPRAGCVGRAQHRFVQGPAADFVFNHVPRHRHKGLPMTSRTLFASIPAAALALSVAACSPASEDPMAADAMKPAGN